MEYDENIAENPFFRKLRETHPELIEAASNQKLIICVPRAGTIAKEVLPKDIMSHILVPNPELPESHFSTEYGDVVLKQRRHLVFRDLAGGTLEVDILFEEIFYTKDFAKYKIWCVDKPLLVKGWNDDRINGMSSFQVVTGLNEAVKLIWSEVNNSQSKHALRKIDASISNFKKNNCGTRCTDLDKLKNNLHLLYNHCLDILLMNRQLKERCKVDAFLLKNLKLSVEMYMINALYNHIFDLITCCTADENEKFNLAIRNLAELQLHEFKVDPKLHEFVPAMKLEIMRLDAQTTVLDKLTCLKKAINIISERYNKKNKSIKILTTDDVIPALIFVIIKSGITHWTTNLHFLKYFTFTEFNCGNDAGAENFLIATLEAAITFIVQNTDLQRRKITLEHEKRESDSKFANKEDYLCYLFSMIKASDEEEVTRLLAPFTGNTNNPNENSLFDMPNLCHPLCNCTECKKKLANTTPNPNSTDKQGSSAIFVAVTYGLPKMVTLLLTFKANVNVLDDAAWSPLHHAACTGYQNILLLLLHARSDINAVNSDENTPLHLACLHGNTNCCKALLFFAEHMKIRLDIDGQNKHGDTALHIASKWGFIEMVQTLLESGARVDILNKFGHTAAQIAHNFKISQLLQENFVHAAVQMPHGTQNVCITEMDLMDNEIRTPKNFLKKIEQVDKVMNAIAANDTKMATYLLGIEEKGKGCHPLCTCRDCIKNKTSSLKLDVIDVNDQDVDGNSPLHIAALYGNIKLTRLLLDSGADVSRVNHLQQTPLHVACKPERSQLISCILASCRLDVIDAQDKNGDTALAYAAASGDSKLIETLLKFEPRINVKNHAGQTPLDIAKENIFPNAMKLLEEGQDRINEADII